MERWNGKIAVVTGASSGIGWCIVKQLVSAGMIVVGLARRLQQMEQLRSQLPADLRERYHPHECDLSSLPALKAAFQWISQQFAGRVHVLINNAGMAQLSKLLDEGNEMLLKEAIDVNLMGAVYCTKEAFRLMQNVMAQGDECHVINVNSLLGHRVPIHIPDCGFNLYPVAKHALRATNEVLRREFFAYKRLRLSSISPGLTQTSFLATAGADEERLQAVPDAGDILTPDDVARGVIFILSSPPHVTIAELLMVPTGEKY